LVAPDVWVAKDDGTDIVLARAIVAVGRDYNGNITARLEWGDGAEVTLVAHETHDGPRTPDDFHRQLVRIVSRLSDAAEAVAVSPAYDESLGWRWVTHPL
jgi:hypothetical protein